MKEKVRVLIAYDGSECADIALEDLKRAGLPAEAEALVMCVADVFVPLPVDKEVEDTVPRYIPDVVRRAHERAQQKLEEARALAKQASEQVKALFPHGRCATRHSLIHRHGLSSEQPSSGSPISSLWEHVVIPCLVAG